MSEVRKGTSRNTENENKRCKIFNKVLNIINTISYAVNLINFIIITLIYYITKQRVCETISIIKMLTISKNLLWPRDLRDKYLTSLNKECQRYEKGHLEIRKMKIKDAKYLIRFQI
jgi:hypothetical protein